ncbi:non-ribosomal peptide synthetase component E (peptide arylation enzyme) [Actinomycetospora succinea]|uniref:Non-ribosomal peptide synthetase component E (Peptide arylation enzyme) n=1 Tax=Actinomycetospora succinea TaxID=663603 RepID=A0A4R6VHZ2_9PSEU|nr:AMP-binding protein [Actinomycetospora succinea]TDQ62396.1 non-ribosomal peptide synthetase component E (peptide arylation enzyme) [Actinomycetospora succinea]
MTRAEYADVWGTRTIADELHAVALAHPDRDAVVAAQGRRTYAALDAETDRIAVGLADLGLAPGDPVIVQVTNRLETVVAWYALLKAGLVPVATLAAHRGHEIAHISRAVGARAHLVEAGTRGIDLVAFAHEQAAGHPTLRHVLVLDDLPAAELDPDEARKRVEEIQRGIDPDDVAVFQLSGGTTGVPKLIPRRHAEYWYNARAYADVLGWSADDRVGHLIPVIHNAGVVCGVHASHAVGACLVLTDHDLDTAMPLLVAERTTSVLFGHVHYRAPEHPLYDELATTLRVVLLSGAKVSEELFAATGRGGAWVGQLFGMAEGMFLVTPRGTSAELRRTTVGVPISPRDEVRVLVPGSEEEVADGDVGELCCRGPYTLRGYFGVDRPEAFTADGAYRTGDLAAVRVLDGHRAISIEGRIKDLINRGGEKINAEEVELLLLAHPHVVEAALVAMPDPRLGERGCAYLATDGTPVTLEDLRAHLGALDVAKFKWPERVELVEALPRTKVGKLDKKAMTAEITEKLRSGR